MSDDHAAHAISAYSSRINTTPNIDRLASGGMRLDTCLCTNSICAPSRASILTGTYSHVNGVLTLNETLDGRQTTFPQLLQASGYQTAIIGKWHLGHGGRSDPSGFDYWNVLPGQGQYHAPELIEMGVRTSYTGYVTDVITDLSLNWLRQRDRTRPFLLCTHHKAPHSPWEPDEKHATMYEDADIPAPETFDDDYSNRSQAAARATLRIGRDLTDRHTKGPPPAGLDESALKWWKYQRFIKDFLRCVASIDDNVGRLLDYLDEEGLTENTIVIYTSDQGAFLGDHGWHDKRFFYEESLRMPFLVRYPQEIPAGAVSDQMVLNVDFAPLFLDYAGLPVPQAPVPQAPVPRAPVPHAMQGASCRAILRGEAPSDWRESMYYRYFMHIETHNTSAHYGIRTRRYKLIYYYEPEPGPQEWELFDLEQDPRELRSVYSAPAYQDIVRQLKGELRRLRAELGDTTNSWE
ncbi:MAG: sulfatase [Chloroflexota bacterium]|nr:sulfatase [Chloroflexota bacterium]